MHNVLKHLLVPTGIVVLLTACNPVQTPSAEVLLVNFSRNIPLIQKLIMVLAFFMGMFFIFRALLKLKIYGEMRTMMSPHARLNQVLLLLFAGALLMYLTTATIPVIVDAVFGSPTITQL